MCFELVPKTERSCMAEWVLSAGLLCQHNNHFWLMFHSVWEENRCSFITCKLLSEIKHRHKRKSECLKMPCPCKYSANGIICGANITCFWHWTRQHECSLSHTHTHPHTQASLTLTEDQGYTPRGLWISIDLRRFPSLLSSAECVCVHVCVPYQMLSIFLIQNIYSV